MRKVYTAHAVVLEIELLLQQTTWCQYWLEVLRFCTHLSVQQLFIADEVSLECTLVRSIHLGRLFFYVICLYRLLSFHFRFFPLTCTANDSSSPVLGRFRVNLYTRTKCFIYYSFSLHFGALPLYRFQRQSQSPPSCFLLYSCFIRNQFRSGSINRSCVKTLYPSDGFPKLLGSNE